MLGLLDRSTQLGMPVAITFQRSLLRQMTHQSVLLLSVIAGMIDLIVFFTPRLESHAGDPSVCTGPGRHLASYLKKSDVGVMNIVVAFLALVSASVFAAHILDALRGGATGSASGPQIRPARSKARPERSRWDQI